MTTDSPLFTNDAATDIAYRNIRAAQDDQMRQVREHCEMLWNLYEPFADHQFQIEIRSNFDARYWEMYLTTFLIREGYAVCCSKPGPDVGIDFEGRRIWFEATSPTRGEEGTADQVPGLRTLAADDEPVMHDIPNEKIMLRYLNSISVKYKEQLPSWLERKIVSPEDAFVIAINSRGLRHIDSDPPRILQAAFAIGSPYVAIDPTTSKAVEVGYQFRDAIKKASGVSVSTGVFHRKEYSGLSGLLCSRIDAANQPDAMGGDFQLVPNPWAKVPLPDKFRLNGAYFRIEHTKDVYIAIPESHS
jgi:hypothetical protein